MQVFLSWSGERSNALASAIRDWLPTVLQQVQPWFSQDDIDKGARWAAELNQQLQQNHIGILCVTPENVEAPWLMFEAGALSKALDNSLVCALLLEMEPSAIRGPLSQFQLTRLNKSELLQLVLSINKRSERPIDASIVERVFEGMWPGFEFALRSIPATARQVAKRSMEDMLEEVIDSVRRIERSTQSGLPGAALFSEHLGETVRVDTEAAVRRMVEVSAELAAVNQRLQESPDALTEHRAPFEDMKKRLLIERDVLRKLLRVVGS
jgi:hypothetical protein